MITMQQEEAVRDIIRDKRDHRNDREISRATGVSHWTVLYQRRLLDAINKIPPLKVEEVRRLLMNGLAVGAVALESATPKKSVFAIRRYFYLQRRESGSMESRECPTCASIMFAKEEMAAAPGTQHAVFRAASELLGISDDDALSLYNIVREVHDLHGQEIITSPLFYHIAVKAEKLLRRIDDKEEKKPR